MNHPKTPLGTPNQLSGTGRLRNIATSIAANACAGVEAAAARGALMKSLQC